MGVGGGQEVQPLIGDWIGGQECSRQTEGLEVGEAGYIVGPGEVQVDGAGRLGGLERAWGPCTSGETRYIGAFQDVSWGGTVGGAGVDPGEARSAQLCQPSHRQTGMALVDIFSRIRASSCHS